MTLMQKSPNSYRVIFSFFLISGLCSCGSLTADLKGSNFIFGSNVTPIEEIQKKQGKQATVYIQGKVEKQVPLMKQWAYQISDASGKIWVITNQSNLQKGTQVVLKGKVRYQSIPLAGQDFGEVYLEE